MNTANSARANGIHDPDALLNNDTRKSIQHGTKTVHDPNITEAIFEKRFIIQEHSLPKITGHITDDGTAVFFAIAERGPISKGPNAIKNGFRQLAREPSPLSTKKGPVEEKKNRENVCYKLVPSTRERAEAKCSQTLLTLGQ